MPERVRIRGQNGFGFIELLIVISIVSAATLFVIGLNLQTRESLKNSSTYYQLDTFNQNVSALAQNPRSLAQTIADNSSGGKFPAGNMDCLNKASNIPCTLEKTANGTPITNQPFALVDGTGTPFYNGLDPSQGVSKTGAPCKFSPSPSAGPAPAFTACPFRFRLTWSAVCTGQGDCLNPQIKITSNLIVDPAYTAPLNASRYSLAGGIGVFINP